MQDIEVNSDGSQYTVTMSKEAFVRLLDSFSSFAITATDEVEEARVKKLGRPRKEQPTLLDKGDEQCRRVT